jgi:catechol 2,3-dioxygenase-like lactoylglutathione lyase family enzyme
MNKTLETAGIDHVVLHVKDLARSKKFYTELLGMDVQHESSRQVFLSCGSQGVALFEARDGAGIHGGDEMNHMALRLKAGDYEKVKAVLEEAGVQVSGRRGDPRCIYFSDPDGHRLQLLTPAEY